MKTIFLHLVIFYGFINLTTSNTSELPIYNVINDILSIGRYGSNGKYNPNIDLNTGQIIRRHGYPSEAHFITTEDGYLLTLHRIPGKPKSHPVLLQHGILCSSVHWVLNGPKYALAFELADSGYDVWLGNFRGNVYTKAHVNMSTADPNFWEFSFHELGIYDLPAMISYITNLKQSNLTYIGHSMGTTSFYVMSIMRPDIASKVQMMFSFAPVAYMGHLNSPIDILAPFTTNLMWYFHEFGENEFVPLNDVILTFIRYFCDSGFIQQEICFTVLSIIVGFDKAENNNTLLPVIMGHTPDSTSYKTINHYTQMISSDKFRQYDYGPIKNLKVYNSVTPPDYDTSKICVPIALYYSENDNFSDVTDVLHLSKELKYLVDLYKIPFKKFNHFDFLFAIHAPSLVYTRLLQTLKENTNKAPTNC
ncbi:hypothetical protein M0804_001066 [Polistes exclamans]|nr:hypothetical protein M0804_001066 [Polistes exclamans]